MPANLTAQLSGIEDMREQIAERAADILREIAEALELVEWLERGQGDAERKFRATLKSIQDEAKALVGDIG